MKLNAFVFTPQNNINIFLPICSMMRWNISGARFMPKGCLGHLNLPIGVLNVDRKEDYSSNSICRKPDFTSNTENAFALGIVDTAFSIVRLG